MNRQNYKTGKYPLSHDKHDHERHRIVLMRTTDRDTLMRESAAQKAPSNWHSSVFSVGKQQPVVAKKTYHQYYT